MKGNDKGRNVPIFDSSHVFHYSISLYLFKAVVTGADSSLYIERWKGHLQAAWIFQHGVGMACLYLCGPVIEQTNRATFLGRVFLLVIFAEV
jgi:hypothetical protein